MSLLHACILARALAGPHIGSCTGIRCQGKKSSSSSSIRLIFILTPSDTVSNSVCESMCPVIRFVHQQHHHTSHSSTSLYILVLSFQTFPPPPVSQTLHSPTRPRNAVSLAHCLYKCNNSIRFLQGTARIVGWKDLGERCRRRVARVAIDIGIIIRQRKLQASVILSRARYLWVVAATLTA